MIAPSSLNAAGEDRPADAAQGQPRLFPARWSARVRRRPDGAVVVHEGRTVTAGQLDARANRIAHHLRALGVGPEVRVGICLERTPELVACILAVLKAGGAYVPVEPWFPADRIAATLRDSGARVLIAGPGAPVVEGVTRVDLVADHEAIDARPETEPGVELHPEMLAHVIYTSGSTGTPKGVMIRHGAVASFLDWMADAFPLAHGERVLGSTSVSFDVHVAEVHFALASGATLVLVRDALGLAELGTDAGIAQASMVPSAARELLRLGALPGSLRRLNLAGEALPADLARGLYAAGLPEVHNVYGPTEDTTYSTHSHVPADTQRVTIGWPLAGRRAYVLDAGFRRADEGVEGELYLAGTGTARGYLGRPGLTAERFVPDPFGAPGERMYATGDRARVLQGGEVEYLGRRDHQVKVRGYRIELGEIEARLREHPSIADAVVVAAGESGATRLAAYVVSAGDAASSAEISAFLRARLPEYMVPSAVMFVGAMPRTASGKVDRAALPAPVWGGDEAYVAPRTATETLLAGIWAEVLGTDRVGAESDFFAIGGHSLLGMQVMARVREAVGVGLPVRALFDAPRLDAFAAMVDAASGEIAPAQPPLVRADRSAPLPLSFAQQRLWFLQQMEPDSPFYNIPAAIRLDGELDADALRRALEEVVSRHEALRTVFTMRAGGPVQVIQPPSAFPLPVRDLSALDPAAREREIDTIVRAEAARRFDLGRDPVLRGLLLRLDPNAHLLLLNLHHVAGDGWSMGVLFRELGQAYGAFATGRAPDLAPLPLQYADYAVWQRRWLTDEVLERQLAYWRERLAGAPPVLELPSDRPRPPVQSHRGAVLPFRVPRPLADRLQEVARAEGATLYMTLLAALNTLLFRWSGQDDVVIGSPIAGRVRRELEGLIGFFVNAMALRTDLSGDPTFRQLLGRVREATLDAYAHQDLPFERLVEEVQPERSLGRAPVFQVTLVVQNTPTPPVHMGGLRLKLDRPGSGTAKFDLSIEFIDDGDGLAGSAEYATDLWDASTIQRLVAQLVHVLDAATADASLPLSRIPLLAPGEAPAVLAASDAPAFGSAVHAQVRRMAARVPHAPAVVFGDAEMTYSQLQARAEHLARHLVSMGVRPDDRVGVFAERGTAMPLALLAVLNAGGAYVPLDPGLPPRRTRQVVRDAGLRVVLVADAETAARLGDAESATVAIIDALEAQPAPSGGALPDAHPEQAAYVIYTSGSTGRPKGVVVTHGALANHMAWMQGRFPLAPDDRVLQKTPFGFDAAVWEFWAPLMAGATLVMAPPQSHRDPRALAEEMARHRVTVAQFVPALLELVLREPAIARCRSLRRVFCGGEALEPRVAAACHAVLNAELCNLYGPTEVCIDATYHVVAAGDASVPIGVPVRGVGAYLLDAAGRPVPVNARGELFLGGAQVARGYVGRPGLTAERFLPDPFGAAPGARMYRTGDEARWRPDGALEFLGRVDQQVKIRGHRIELGEVEAVLKQHPFVADAAVQARPDPEGNPRLVGWVVPARTAPGAETAAEAVSWEAVFEGMYGREEAWATEDATFNVTGWTDSYTGQPIDPAAMHEWVDRTAERILSLSPDRVLELGVGSGLFLFRVAPRGSLYVGSDLSANAIRALSDALPRAGVRLPPVRLLARPADDFSGLDPRSFDTVILNSVVQYFPSAHYLERVVAGAVESVRDGGAVFLGDLRSLSTMGALHAAVELAHAPDALPADELRRRVARRRDDEEELVLDPRFFSALRARVPRLASVEVMLKRGVHHNELTRHRYDVVLRVGEGSVAPAAAWETSWGGEVRTVADVAALLGGEPLRVSGIPDARVAPEVRLAERLADVDPEMTAGELRAIPAPPAIDPEAVWALAETHGMKAVLRPSPGLPGCFDAAFVPAECDLPAFADPDAPGEPAAWASDPGRAALIRGLVPELRAHLREQLPEYMVPAALLTLDALPRTVSGKLDRRALPDPEPARVAGGPAYVAPRTETETALCALWSELLRVDRVGVDDGFFDLGGHSLLATVLVSRIRERWGMEMALHRVFQTPTVAGLAEAVDEANERVLATLFAELDDMSDDEARALLALEAQGVVG